MVGAEGQLPLERAGPGRPRKWANDAERARAYRERKAAERANVDELRRDRRSLRRQLQVATRARERVESEVARIRARADRLDEYLARAQAEIARIRSENERLHTALEAERLSREPATNRPTANPPAPLSRQQRRALDRRQKKRQRDS